MKRGAKLHPKPPLHLVLSIVEQVSEETGIAVADICGGSQSKFIACGRHDVWRALRLKGYSISSIARGWGCSPSAVTNAIYGKTGRKPVRKAA